jgi:hypothetical protein
MRCRIHVLDRSTCLVSAAELIADGDGSPTVVLADGRPFDAELFEVLPFPLVDELGAASFDGGAP